MTTHNDKTNNSGAADNRKVCKKDIKSFAAKVSFLASALVLAEFSRINDMHLLQIECDEDSSIVLSWKLGIYGGAMAFFLCSLTDAENVVHSLVMAELVNTPMDSESYVKSYLKAALAVLNRLGLRSTP